MNRIRIGIIHELPASVKFVTDTINETRDIEIVGTASDFRFGFDMVSSQTPDIILVQDGIAIADFTAKILQKYPDVGIIIMMATNDMVSVNRVVTALANGAFDFITHVEKSETLNSLLLSKIRCCSIKQYSHRARQSEAEKPALLHPVKTDVHSAAGKTSLRSGPIATLAKPKFDAVLVGVSTGGPVALMELLPCIPASFPIPIIIVLHMPREFTGPMAAALDRKTKIRVKEAEEGETPVRGMAYLAPGGIHCMLQGESHGGIRLHIADGPPENGCRPAVDVLFRSAAPLLGNRVLAVILTGMGIDGTKGAQDIKQGGGCLLVQDEQSSIVWGMPGSAVRAGLANEVLPLNRIAVRLCELIGAAHD